MIPIALLAGALAAPARKGFLILPVMLVAWPALLIATDVDSGFDFFVSAGLLGAANTLFSYVFVRSAAGTVRAVSRFLA